MTQSLKSEKDVCVCSGRASGLEGRVDAGVCISLRYLFACLSLLGRGDSVFEVRK